MKFKTILFVIASLTLSLLDGCNKKDIAQKEEKQKEQIKYVKLTAESKRLINLKTEAVSLSPLSGFITLPAVVVPNQDNVAQVGTLVQGRTQKVLANIGDFVKKGQVLMTVEGLDIGTIKASYMKAKAHYEYTKATFERQQKLFKEKIGSQKSLLESQAEYEKSMAEFKAEDKRIHSIGLSDEDVLNAQSADEHTAGSLNVKSPIDGIVVERNIVTGQHIDATTNAFKIMNTNNVWIDGQLFEKDLSKISKKTTAAFNTSVYPNENFDGKIIYLGQIIDEKSRTLLIRCEFANRQNKLKPQMFGELQIPIGDNVMSILVPEESVIKEAGLSYVFVEKSDTLYELRLVSTGIVSGKKIEIKDGLKEGEQIVSEGVFYLKSELKKEELEGD